MLAKLLWDRGFFFHWRELISVYGSLDHIIDIVHWSIKQYYINNIDYLERNLLHWIYSLKLFKIMKFYRPSIVYHPWQIEFVENTLKDRHTRISINCFEKRQRRSWLFFFVFFVFTDPLGTAMRFPRLLFFPIKGGKSFPLPLFFCTFCPTKK